MHTSPQPMRSWSMPAGSFGSIDGTARLPTVNADGQVNAQQRQQGNAGAISPGQVQATIDAYPNATALNMVVTYDSEEMFHVGVEAYDADAGHDRLGLTNAAPYHFIHADGLRTAEALTQGPKLTGRYSFKVWPSERSATHNEFVVADYNRGLRRAIGSVDMQWTGQPVLELELVDMSPKVRISPVQSMWLPQREIYYQDDLSTGSEVQFTNTTSTVTVRMSNVRLNEVFTTVTIFGQLHDDNKVHFDYVAYLRPFIRSINVQVAESPNITTQYSSEVIYRMYKENTLSRATYNQWRSNCICVLSPQQLGITNFRRPGNCFGN